MKNAIITLSLVCFTLSTFAQNTSELSKKEYNKKVFLRQKNTISFSPFNLAFRQIVISYERKFGNKNSFVLQNSFKIPNTSKKTNYPSRFSSSFKFNSEIQYRRYLTYFQLRKNKFPDTKNAFGVYLAPLVGYEYGEQHYRSVENEYSGLGTFNYSADKFFNALQGGLLAGVNFDIIYGKLSVQLYVGAAYKHSWVIHNQSHFGVNTYYSMKPGIMAYAYTGFIPKINFQLGFNF